MKQAVISLLAFAIAYAFTPNAAQAEPEFHYEAFKAHYREYMKDIETLQQLANDPIFNDILETEKSMIDAYQNNCLKLLHSDIQALDHEFVENVHLLSLAISMQNEVDEIPVYNLLNETLGDLLETFSSLRKNANQMAGICNKSATENSYRQEIKKYLEKAVPAIESIKKRIAAENADLLADLQRESKKDSGLK